MHPAHESLLLRFVASWFFSIAVVLAVSVAPRPLPFPRCSTMCTTARRMYCLSPHTRVVPARPSCMRRTWLTTASFTTAPMAACRTCGQSATYRCTRPSSMSYLDQNNPASTVLYVCDSSLGQLLRVDVTTGQADDTMSYQLPQQIWECGLVLGEDADHTQLYTVDRHRGYTARFSWATLTNTSL